MMRSQLKELILQSLEHERGGVLVYQTALECVVNPDLEKEWTKYLDQTRHHVDVLTKVCERLGLDPSETTPGCKVVQHTGKSLVTAMKMALGEGDMPAAQLVACECVVLAETKDHADWQLLSLCAKAMDDEEGKILLDACEEIEEEEDEHLYHTQGWCRELWLESLEMPAVLPPPEEEKGVTSAIGAAKAKAKSIAERQH